MDSRSTTVGLDEMHYPYLRYYPTDETPENSYLAYPMGIGRLLPNPFGDAAHRMNYQFPGSVYDYPTRHNMQWNTIYDHDTGGLYFGADDAQGYRKQFYYSGRPSEFHLHGVWFPDNRYQIGGRLQSHVTISSRAT